MVVLLALLVLLAELAGLVAATPAGAQEIRPPITVDGPGPCRRIGGDWLPPGFCELTGPLRIAPDDSLVLAVGAFLLGPVDVDGRLEVQGAASLVFFFGDLANRGELAVTGGGVAYVAGRATSPGAVELSGGGRMEILSDGGALATTGPFDVAADGRLDVYGTFDSQGDPTTNLGVVAVWCSGSLLGSAPVGLAAQVQDCRPPEISLVSRTPAGSSGWNRGTVRVVWACTDEGSGVVTERVSAVLSGDGAEQSAFGVCTDLAGNTATGVVTGINIERPAPRTRRQPAPPVVVHLDPTAPAPPPTAPPTTTLPSTTTTTPLLLPTPPPPDAALPGPSITDPVSSPDPAPIAPTTSTVTPITTAAQDPVPSSSAPTSTSWSTSTSTTSTTSATTSTTSATTSTTQGSTSAAPPPPASPPATSAESDRAPVPTTTAPVSPNAGSGPSTTPRKVGRARPIRHAHRTGAPTPPG